MFCVETDVERESSALAEPAQDDVGGTDTTVHLRHYQRLDVLSGFLYPDLILRPIRVERLEIEPRGHGEPGVEGDGHLVGAGADELEAGRLDGGEGAGPAVSRVSKAVEEDERGGVGGGWLDEDGVRPAGHGVGSLVSQSRQCRSHTCVVTPGWSGSPVISLQWWAVES